MPRPKSVTMLTDEIAITALNLLMIYTVKKKTPDINVPFLTMCMSSGRLEDVSRHLSEKLREHMPS